MFVCQVSCMLCVRSALHIDRGSPLLASRAVLLVFVPIASRIPCHTRRYEKPLVSRSTAEVFYNRQKSPGVWCSWFDVARTQELPFLHRNVKIKLRERALGAVLARTCACAVRALYAWAPRLRGFRPMHTVKRKCAYAILSVLLVDRGNREAARARV